MSNFGDPGFNRHAAVGKVWLAVAMAIATTPIIPYNVADYARTVTSLYDNLKKDYETALLSHNVSLGMSLYMHTLSLLQCRIVKSVIE